MMKTIKKLFSCMRTSSKVLFGIWVVMSAFGAADGQIEGLFYGAFAFAIIIFPIIYILERKHNVVWAELREKFNEAKEKNALEAAKELQQHKEQQRLYEQERKRIEQEEYESNIRNVIFSEQTQTQMRTDISDSIIQIKSAIDNAKNTTDVHQFFNYRYQGLRRTHTILKICENHGEYMTPELERFTDDVLENRAFDVKALVFRCVEKGVFFDQREMFLHYLDVMSDEEKEIIEEMLDEKTISDVSQIDGMEGHEFEYYCAELLNKNGFDQVEVTRGSGDQGVDILAIKDGIKYAIQCKNYMTPLSNKPVQEVNAGKVFYQCHVGVVMTNSTLTPGAKELAKATGVLIWDRTVVQQFIDNAK